MQQLDFQPFEGVKVRARAHRALRGKELPAQADNDETYVVEATGLQLLVSVVLNALGGALLFASMVSLPYLLSAFHG